VNLFFIADFFKINLNTRGQIRAQGVLLRLSTEYKHLPKKINTISCG
jgi:hypothetical protein